MKILGILCALISAVSLFSLLLDLMRDRVYWQGYERGRREEAQWWLGVEEMIEPAEDRRRA